MAGETEVGGDDETPDSDFELFSDESEGGGGAPAKDDDETDVHDHPIPGIDKDKEKEKDDDESFDDSEEDDEEGDDDLDADDEDDEDDEEDEEDEGAPEGKEKKRAPKDAGKEEEDEDEDDEDLLKDKAPTTKVAEKRYAKVWKEHPELRGPYYRDRQFREAFATPELAKEASEQVAFFSMLESQISSGNPAGLLINLAKYGEEGALAKFARAFGPALTKIDERLEGVVARPYINKFLKAAVAEARRLGSGKDQPGRNLAASVEHLLMFMHPEGKPEFVEDKAPPPPTEDPEKKRLQDEVQRTRAELTQKFDTRARRSGHRMLDNKITKLVINAGKDHKKTTGKELSKLELRALARGVKERLIGLLDRDADHNQAMESAWKAAERRGYADDAIPEVTRAFLRGANSLLPRVLKRELQEALGYKKKKGAPRVPGGGAPHGGREGKGGRREPIPFSRYDTTKSKDPDFDLFNDSLPLKKRG